MIDWSLLWPFLQDLIRQFAERCGTDEVSVQAQTPVMQRWGVTKGLRAQGKNGRELRQARREALRVLNNFDSGDVQEFVLACVERDDD